MSTAKQSDIPDIIGQMDRIASTQPTELGRIMDSTKKRYIVLFDSNDLDAERLFLSDSGRGLPIEIDLNTANKLLHTQDYAKAKEILDQGRADRGERKQKIKNAKRLKTPRSAEKQKRLTWDPWEYIKENDNDIGGPYIKIYMRSDGGAGSLARNSKPPYVQIDIDLARELVRSLDYEKAKQIFEAGLAKKSSQKQERRAPEEYSPKEENEETQETVKGEMRGKISRILHRLKWW